MGNTTRRQPITHSIPAAPNYKFLNITDFRGLNVTDNPFTAQPNTASDCLNVYVDENNALSTRPRLEKRINFATNGYSVVNVYPINSGYLVHRKKDNVYSLWIVKQSDLLQPILVEGEMVDNVNRLTVFEQNNIIYVLDGTKMRAIIEKDGKYNCGQIEPYIPTLYGGLSSLGEISKDKVKQLEPLNLLTDLYKETFYWDGVSTLNLDNPEKISAENNYFIDKYVNAKEDIAGKGIIKHNSNMTEYMSKDNLPTVNDNSALPSVQSYTLYRHLVKNDELETSKFMCSSSGASVEMVIPKGYFYTVSDDLNVVFVFNPSDRTAYLYHRVASDDIYKLYTKEDSISTLDSQIDCVGIDIIDNKPIIYTPDSAIICEFVFGTNNTFGIRTSKTFNKVENIASNTQGTITALITTEEKGHNVYFTTSALKDIPTDFTTKYPYVYTEILGNDYYGTHPKIQVSFASTKCALYYDERIVIIDNITTTPKIVKETRLRNIIQYTLSETSGFAYGRYAQEIEEEHDYAYYLAVFPDIAKDPDKYYNTLHEVPSNGRLYYDTHSILMTFAPDEIDQAKNNYHDSILEQYLDNHEPCITTLNKISRLNRNIYEKYNENKDLIGQTKLYIRFDNKMWLAHKNKLFYSKYDNLNYFPITQYDIIGDDTDVTSFNLASDSLLIVYKNNAICTVYPTTVNNEYTYVFADSKNTVGNDAIGNSIVSVLTERPLQITTKGIYALKQVENIESNSRISELISEPINKKWLQESDYVPQCITMNRLYWTYFILPYDKYTKVYLLDNRTSSWYYWELPVVTINAFVKDDKSMIVSSNGRLYSLETTDTISIHNPDTTEYYDDDRKLIKWYWTSQILPLGTINYSKRLVDTTFIVADTDASDSYALNYKFKTYRKLASESNATTITNRLNYIQSTTKKTLIPRFNFIQIEISNVEEDAAEALDNNKIRLVGLGLKYILLEALI